MQVNATQIRRATLKNWQYIPTEVRPILPPKNNRAKFPNHHGDFNVGNARMSS